MKKFIIPIFILLFGLFLFFARQSKYNDFHKAAINGKIDTLYRFRHYVMIRIDTVEYRIIPIPLNAKSRFDDVVKIGDELLKPANRDTFTIIHDGDEGFSFSVQKY